MKKTKYVHYRFMWLSILSAIICLTSCMPDGADIGDLYGRWKLNGVTAPTTVEYCDTLYLSFQGDVFQYQPHWDYDWGTFRKTADSLILNPLQYGKYHFAELGLTILADDQSAAFKLDALSDKQLQLSRHDTVWIFKKYIE